MRQETPPSPTVAPAGGGACCCCWDASGGMPSPVLAQYGFSSRACVGVAQDASVLRVGHSPTPHNRGQPRSVRSAARLLKQCVLAAAVTRTPPTHRPLLLLGLGSSCNCWVLRRRRSHALVLGVAHPVHACRCPHFVAGRLRSCAVKGASERVKPTTGGHRCDAPAAASPSRSSPDGSPDELLSEPPPSSWRSSPLLLSSPPWRRLLLWRSFLCFLSFRCRLRALRSASAAAARSAEASTTVTPASKPDILSVSRGEADEPLLRKPHPTLAYTMREAATHKWCTASGGERSSDTSSRELGPLRRQASSRARVCVSAVGHQTPESMR